MRLSRKFIKNLEDLSCDLRLTPDERMGAAELLVRLFSTEGKVRTTLSRVESQQAQAPASQQQDFLKAMEKLK